MYEDQIIYDSKFKLNQYIFIYYKLIRISYNKNNCNKLKFDS